MRDETSWTVAPGVRYYLTEAIFLRSELDMGGVLMLRQSGVKLYTGIFDTGVNAE